MSLNVRVLYVFVACNAAGPAFATSGVSPAPSEAGFTTHHMPSTTTRTEVLRQLAEWRRNPLAADGWREIGGEAGWLLVDGAPTTKSRAQVRRELREWQRNPVSADGWMEVNGEPGWTYMGNAARRP